MIYQLTSTASLKGSQDLFHTLSMALYHKWDVKNDFPYVLQFFSFISDGLGSVMDYYFHFWVKKHSKLTWKFRIKI